MLIACDDGDLASQALRDAAQQRGLHVVLGCAQRDRQLAVLPVLGLMVYQRAPLSLPAHTKQPTMCSSWGQ